MKKKPIIILIILTVLVVLTFTLIACKKDSNAVVATFELDENDGIDNFLLRRGVYFNHKITEINKIDGVTASWQTGDDGVVQIRVSNGKAHLDEVREIINGEVSLQFKTENSAAASAQFNGKNNIKSITLSADKASIQIEFTASGGETVNNYHNRQLYLYLGDECLVTMTSRIILTSANPTVTISVPSNSNPMYPETLTAQLNAAAFGLKFKSVSIK